jgi:hypothetical protein
MGPFLLDILLFCPFSHFKKFLPNMSGPVTKIKNIKTDETKILRPTDFSGSKDIKTDRFFVGLSL